MQTLRRPIPAPEDPSPSPDGPDAGISGFFPYFMSLGGIHGGAPHDHGCMPVTSLQPKCQPFTSPGDQWAPADAVDELIALIKEGGDWVEPEGNGA